MNSKITGNKSTAKILSKLLDLGYKVSIPFGDDTRYDLIADTGKKLLRIQCKTAWMQNGCVAFNHRSITTKNGREISVAYTTDDIDLLLIYSPELDKIYSVPIGTSSTLRVKQPKSNQKKNIKWAKDYEFNGDVV